MLQEVTLSQVLTIIPENKGNEKMAGVMRVKERDEGDRRKFFASLLCNINICII
jgi:hypothetical protein